MNQNGVTAMKKKKKELATTGRKRSGWNADGMGNLSDGRQNE